MKRKRPLRRPGSGLRRIFFATDFSAASNPAWRKALEIAKSSGASLTILHVVAPLALGHSARWAYAELEAELRTDARRRLEALRRRAQTNGVTAETLLLRGEPHVEIARAARARRAGWIVVGTHGRTGLAGAFIGSVASRVVATAPCPVMTVRRK